jgi:hypothetical protein
MTGMVPRPGTEITAEILALAEKRFWAKVEKRSEGECWPWRGTVLPKGYPRLKVARRQFLATRLALHFAGRPISTGQYACHSCDNPRCVNPAHLFAGSHSANMLDMYAKGRRRQDGEHNPRFGKARKVPQ